MLEYVPDRAADLADGDAVAREPQPVAAAGHAEGQVGDPVAEGVGLGVDAVGAPDPQRRAVLEPQVAQHGDQPVGPLEQQVGGLDELQRERRVEQIGRRHAEVHVGGGLAGIGLVRPRGRKAITSCWVTASISATASGVGRRRVAYRFDGGLPVRPRRQRGPRAPAPRPGTTARTCGPRTRPAPSRAGCSARSPSAARPAAAACSNDSLNSSSLARSAGSWPAMICTASTAAFVELSRPTQATGTPGGICEIDEQRVEPVERSAADRDADHGQAAVRGARRRAAPPTGRRRR